MWQLKTKRQVTCEWELLFYPFNRAQISIVEERERVGKICTRFSSLTIAFLFMSSVFLLLFSVYHRFSYQIKFELTVKFCANCIFNQIGWYFSSSKCHIHFGGRFPFPSILLVHLKIAIFFLNLYSKPTISLYLFRIHNFIVKNCDILHRSFESDYSFCIDCNHGITTT